MKRHLRCVGDERGQSAIEFAVVIPFLVLLILGIVGFSDAYSRYETLVDATTAAARFEATCRTQALGDANSVGTSQANSIPGGATFNFNYYGTANSAPHAAACQITSGEKVTVTGTANTISLNLGLFSLSVPLSSSVTVTEA
jgi:Flp pilus assembly protein TadG